MTTRLHWLRNSGPFYLLLFLLTGVTTALKGQSTAPGYEFRGAWIATVDNIDWPSRKGLPVDSQKAEFIRMLDLHKSNGLNAIIMQIRPAADAFYPSPYEPWSEWLSGVQGKPPFPYYDPLQFMIEETHRRGMEFHAWCNPYRAIFNTGKSSIAPTHITRMHPEWFLDYGDKRYFDPGNKEVQTFVTQIVGDIVHRYDVDAIHFDDYFYPYRISGKSFPDSVSYNKYSNGLHLEDWRRSNVDSIIVELYRVIRKENPRCQFGISPFGVWRNQDKDPRGSATKAGQTNYDDLYADILLWLEKGWIDYVVPQLYWEFGHPAAPFDTLLEWWSTHTFGKACYIGLGYFKAGSNKTWRDHTLIPRQIQAMRNTPNINGAVYFSSKTFIRNPLGWNDSLRNNYYQYPALIPPIEGIRGENPPSPSIRNITIPDNRKIQFSVTAPAGESHKIRQVALYALYSANSNFSQARLIDLKPYSDTVQYSIEHPENIEFVQYFLNYVSPQNHESQTRNGEPVSIRLIKNKNGEWLLKD